MALTGRDRRASGEHRARLRAILEGRKHECLQESNLRSERLAQAGCYPGRTMTMVKRSWRHLLVLALLVAVHTVNSVAVINQDQGPMRGDAIDHFRWAGQVAKPLSEGRVAEAAGRWWSYYQRPPLGILPTVLAMVCSGGHHSDPALARASILLWFILLMLATYGVAARLGTAMGGLLSCVALAAMPSVIGFSRLLWLDLPLAAMVTLFIWIMLQTDGLRRAGPVVALGIAAGAGMLVKPAFLLFALPPALCYLLFALPPRGQGRARPMLLAGLALLIALALFSGWAAGHLDALIRSVRMASSGGEGAFSSGSSLGSLVFSMAGLPLFLLSLVGVAALAVSGRWRTLALMGTWLVCSMLALSLFVKWDRYLIPALPAVAVLTGAGLSELCQRMGRWLSPLVFVLLMGLGIGQSWIGPMLHRCRAHPALGRTACAGMVRPVLTPPPTVDLSFLPGAPGARWATVLPWVLEGSGSGAGELGEFFQYQLVLAGQVNLKMEPEWRFEQCFPRCLGVFKYLFLLQQRSAGGASREAKVVSSAWAWVGEHPERWRELRVLVLPAGLKVRVLENLRYTHQADFFYGRW